MPKKINTDPEVKEVQKQIEHYRALTKELRIKLKLLTTKKTDEKFEVKDRKRKDIILLFD